MRGLPLRGRPVAEFYIRHAAEHPQAPRGVVTSASPYIVAKRVPQPVGRTPEPRSKSS